MNTKLVYMMMCAIATAGAPLASATEAWSSAVYKAPRNGFGQPDFTGTWTNSMATRLERPASYGDRLVMTEKEVADIENERAGMKKAGGEPTPLDYTTRDIVKTCNVPGLKGGGVGCAVPEAFFDFGDFVGRVNGQPRTSLITYPADGHIPYKQDKKPVRPFGTADNPEDRTLADRCIVGENTFQGMLMTPTLYNNTYLVQQGKNAAVIVLEMSHEPRIIRLDTQHSPYPKWYGDTIGHYEGDTLVAETTNYQPEQLAGHNSPQLKVTERFTRVGPERLLYQFRVEDPVYYSQPWGGEYEFSSSKGMQYEYGCHEGNYGLMGILQGARAEEKAGRPSSAPFAVNGDLEAPGRP